MRAWSDNVREDKGGGSAYWGRDDDDDTTFVVPMVVGKTGTVLVFVVVLVDEGLARAMSGDGVGMAVRWWKLVICFSCLLSCFLRLSSLALLLLFGFTVSTGSLSLSLFYSAYQFPYFRPPASRPQRASALPVAAHTPCSRPSRHKRHHSATNARPLHRLLAKLRHVI